MMELRSRPARFVLFLAALTRITPLPPASAFFVPAFAPGTAALSTTKVKVGIIADAWSIVCCGVHFGVYQQATAFAACCVGV